MDSEEGTWNLDVDLIENLITPKTKGIHSGSVWPSGRYGCVDGCWRTNTTWLSSKTVPNRMAPPVVAHDGQLRRRGLFRFYANKVITTGEGGMVVTNDKALVERLRLLRNLAFTTPRFRLTSLATIFA